MLAQKPRFILFFALFCSSVAFSQGKADSTRIEAFIEGITAGTTKVVGMYGDQNYIADTAIIDATGHFILKRKSPLPAGLYTFLLPGNKSFSILLDNNEQFVTIRAKSSDFLGSLQVQGSLNTDLFYQTNRFQVAQEPELNQLAEQLKKLTPDSPEHKQAKARQDQLVAERKTYLDGIFKQNPDAFFTKFKYAGQNPDFIEFKKPNGQTDTIRQVVSFRNRLWDNVDFSDERLLRTPVVVNKLKRYIKELTTPQPDSLIKATDFLVKKALPYPAYFKFFTNFIALQHENTKTTVMDGEAVYVHIIKNYFTDELATWDTRENLEKLRKHVSEMEASLMGRKGPDVIAPDASGQMRSIYEKKAPLIVVLMFNPDCEHCQKDAAEIEAIYRKWKDRGVDFYGIAVNTTDEEWKEFLRKYGFTFTNVFDPSNRAIYGKYYVDITPELYILNKDRTIVAKNLKANQLEEVFQREFRKMK